MRLISGTLRSAPLPWLPVLSNIEPPALRRKAATDKLVDKIVKHDSWPIQPDILNPPLLRLTSRITRKRLWLDLQPADIKSRWRHNWKLAEVVNSHLVSIPQSGNRVLTSFSNNGLYWTVFARNRETTVPAEGNCDLQTLIYVIAARLRQCPTLPNPVPWGSDKAEWRLIPATLCRMMKTLYRGLPIMGHDTHTSRRRSDMFSVEYGVTLKCGLVVIQGHWNNVIKKWSRLVDHIWLSVGLPLYI